MALKKENNSAVKNNTESTTKVSKKRKESSKSDNVPTSREKQKEIKKKRQASRPHAEVVAEAKTIWDNLRLKNVPRTERKAMVEQLMSLLSGKMFELASKHDASRILQTLLQYGSPSQRTVIIKEMQEHIVDLSKVQFGHFLVTKMIRYGSKEDRSIIAKQMTGNVVKLATNAIAAGVIECAYEWFKPSLMSALTLEFYGKEHVFFKLEGLKNLSDIISAGDDEKKQAVLAHMTTVLNRMVEKQLLGHAFVQRLLCEFMENATPHHHIVNLIPSLRDAALALLATSYGARAVCVVLGAGTPKDRKRVVHSLKGKVLDACNHPSGYLVLLSIINVVDDTVMVQKRIFGEIVPHLFDVAMHEKGSKVLLQLLSPNCKSYVDQRELEILKPPMVPSTENNELVVNYKKSPESRRSELLKSIDTPLVEMCQEYVMELMYSPIGSRVLVEVVKRDMENTINSKIVEKILTAVHHGATSTSSSEVEQLHAHAVAHKTIQNLLKIEDFASCFYEVVVKPNPSIVSEWALKSKRGSFVVLTLLQSTCNEVASSVKGSLKSHISDIQELAKTQTGSQLILKKLL